MSGPATNPIQPDSALGWALWQRDVAACRRLAAAEPDPRRRELVQAIADGMTGTCTIPARLMATESDTEVTLAVLYVVLQAALHDCDGGEGLHAAERMRRLDHPGLPPVLRALIARAEVLCSDAFEGGMRLGVLAERGLAMAEQPGDSRLRIGLAAVLVRALAGVDPVRADALLERLRSESPEALRAAGCSFAQIEAEVMLATGRTGDVLARFAVQAGDRRAFLDHPALPFYLAALGAEGRIVELGRWLGDWRSRLDADGSPSVQVRNRRNVMLGIAFMHALMCRDFAAARGFLRERRADLSPGRGNPPRLLRAALDIVLAERSTARARALLERLDPQGTSQALALRWCRLLVQEGALAEAAQRFIAIQAAGDMGPRRIELAIASDLDAPRMLELLGEVERQRRGQREPAVGGKSRVAADQGPVLVGRSPAMAAVREAMARYALLRQPVLIIGETGTGKDVIARRLHAASGDPAAPFLPLNCAAVPDSLAEAELFGHESGAFTGAGPARAGIIEAAGTGTVFLDEVSSMPLRLQGVMLRVLEAGDFRRVGDTRQRQSAARFIFAANEPLEQAVAEGRFREDLLYRLRRFVIEAPPLRSRKEDIPDLCDHFIRGCTGSDQIRPSAELLRRLQAHDWPGNVRELRNEIERIAVLYPEMRQLPASAFEPAARAAPRGPASAGAVSPAGLHGLPATRQRRRRILELLDRHGRLHRAEVVDALGCSPATATRDLQELGDAGLIRRVETSGHLRTSYFIRVPADATRPPPEAQPPRG